MQRTAIIILFLLIISNIFSQNKTISGFIYNTDGEALIGVTVYDQVSKKGTLSNDFGFYSLKLNKDSANLYISLIGYKTIYKSIGLTANKHINFSLQPSTYIETVYVIAKKDTEGDLNFVKIPTKQLNAVPSLTGEVDIMKAYQLMPGIASGTEGSNAIYVRGGSPDQNLFLLDDVPLYDVSHLGGFISVFDNSAIKDMTLIKGAFPAKYGGRLSSVVDIRMKDGNMREYHGKIMLSPLVSKLFFEGPIVKNKTSFMLSARRSYIDIFMNTYMRLRYGKGNKATYRFYDVNFKINQKIKEKDRLFLSAYSGNDKIFGDFAYTDNDHGTLGSIKARTQWGNNLLSLRWNHVYNGSLFSNLTFAYTNYKFYTFVKAFEQQIYQVIDTTVVQSNSPYPIYYNDTTSASFGNNYGLSLFDYTAKIDYNQYINPKTEFSWGGAYIPHTYKPEETHAYLKTDSVNINNIYKDTTTRAVEIYIYGSGKFQTGKHLFFDIGIHYSIYLVNSMFFNSIQPRLNMKLKFNEKLILGANYSKMVQYLHLLPSTDLSRPTDFWVPANGYAQPENAEQYSVNIAYTDNKKTYKFSLEAYYKKMNNLVEMKRNQTFFGSQGSWMDKIERSGMGISKGIELLIKKNTGKINGWIAYTLSKTERRFKNSTINSGNWFPFKYDRRHDLSFFFNYMINEHINLSATWVFMTGSTMTLAGQKFLALDFKEINSNIENITGWDFKDAYIYDGKNNYRMPPYHRLDLAAQFTKKKKRGIRTWNIGIYNAYNRRNPYFLFYKKENVTNKIQLYKFSLFPVIPSIAYSFKF